MPDRYRINKTYTGIRLLLIGHTGEPRMRLVAPPLPSANARISQLREAAGGLRALRPPREKLECGLSLGPRKRPRRPKRQHPYPSEASAD